MKMIREENKMKITLKIIIAGIIAALGCCALPQNSISGVTTEEICTVYLMSNKNGIKILNVKIFESNQLIKEVDTLTNNKYAITVHNSVQLKSVYSVVLHRVKYNSNGYPVFPQQSNDTTYIFNQDTIATNNMTWFIK
jgi:hypothetical protein